MGIRMATSKAKLEEQEEIRKTVPGGVYTVKLLGFDPQLSTDKRSVNYRPIQVVIDCPKDANGDPVIPDELLGKKRFFENLNENANWIHTDLVHAYGLEMVDDGNGNFVIPGEYIGKNGASPDPNNPATWLYSGPLTGRTAKVEVEVSENEKTKQPQNKIVHYFCVLDRCEVKHTARLK